MRFYRVELREATLAGGRIALTLAQARRRLDRLKPNTLQDHGADGSQRRVYEITRPVLFKIGDEIGYDGDVPAALSGHLVDLDGQTAAAVRSVSARLLEQHNTLVAALGKVPCDDAAALNQAIADAGLDFSPSERQIEAAWCVVLFSRDNNLT